MQPGEPILIISHTFPPYRGVGGRRWAKLAKELARRGHPVHVVHADQGEALKGSLWNADIEQEGIHRYVLPARYPQVLMKRPLTSFAERLAYRLWVRVLPWMVRGNVFDRSVRWAPVLLPACQALIDRHGILHVIATGPPFAYLQRLLVLKSSKDVHLVADLRDPWTWGHLYGRESMGMRQRATEDRLELEVMMGYDRITTPSAAILAHLHQAYPKHAAKCTLLEHIIDPDELSQLPQPVNDGMFRMIYAGSMGHEAGFADYFVEVLKAFGSVRDLAPERWRNLVFDLFITGHDTTRVQRMVHEAGQEDRIHFRHPVPGHELSPLIRRADVVLAFMPREKKDLVTTKLNEIAYLGTPILHIGDAGGMADHVVSRGLGDTLRVEDVAAQLPFVLMGERRVENTGVYRAEEHLLGTVTDKLLRNILA
ncbi:MAG: hypothetical protein WAU70_17245 [Flavobacteriales bacterium]